MADLRQKLLITAIIFAYLCCFTTFSNGQFISRPKDVVKWCAVGDFEYKKCEDFASAVKASGQFDMMLKCVKTWSKDECLSKLDSFEADLVALDPGDVFVGGRYHSLIPIMVEKYGQAAESSYFAVAVVNRSSPIRSIEDLRGKRGCFPGVGQLAGWVLPMAQLLRTAIMPVTDCNNLLKSASDFFSASCAPNALIDKYNPKGDNSLSLCERCGVDHDTKCLDSDTFAGFGGAFRCMLGNRGDIAFVKHTTAEEMSRNQALGISLNNFELVCPQGYNRAPLAAYKTCNWGEVPSHAIMTSSEATQEMIRKFQSFVKTAVHLFGLTGQPFRPQNIPNQGQQFGQPNRSPNQPPFNQGAVGFRLFESQGKYGNNYNLLFQDTTTQIDDIAEGKQTFKDYLGKIEDVILELRKCPVESVKLCVVSDVEMTKCIRMRTAMRAQLLKPELVCFRGKSQRDCMASVRMSYADLAVLDAGDVYTAGKEFGLIPILAEQYNLDGTYYYAVAVAKIEDPDTDLLFVRGKYSCHTAIGAAAGWVMPINFLLKNSRLRDWGCDGARAASEFFQKSCAPGGLSAEYNHGWQQNNLCDLCHGTGDAVCRRDHSEDFYGYTGAYRCLVEGGGHIAFVKHTTVLENANGNNQQWWGRNLLSEDYELLCRDGSRKQVHEYEDCNLGKVPGNAIVARPEQPAADGEAPPALDYYVNLFLYAQQFYSSKSGEEFKFQMFRSDFPYRDVIFQDAAQQLVPIEPEMRNYLDYLGYDFVHAKLAVDCTAGAGSMRISLFSVVMAIVLSLVLH